MSALDELRRLLDESPDSVVERERSAFDAVASGRREVVLYGAGNLGRRALAGLSAEGYDVVSFVDNAPAKHGATIDGVRVRSFADGVGAFPHAVWIVTIWGAGWAHRYEDTYASLRAAGLARVVPAAAVFWKHPARFLPYWAIDLPSRVIAAREPILACGRLLADEPSRAELVRQVRWRLSFDASAFGAPAPDEYFPRDLFAPRARETFVDCGGYDGDTLAMFAAWSGEAFDRALVLEPDPRNREALERRIATMPAAVRERVQVSPCAAHSHRATLRFGAGEGTSTRRDDSAASSVEAAPLDELARGLQPTLVKMDIEGAELDALAGARQLIAEHRPRLSICVYHVQDHLWRVPLAIHDASPSLRLYLRNHGHEGWDAVCYAAPEGA